MANMLMDTMRHHLETCGWTRAEIARATGMPESVLSRFYAEGKPLRGDNAGKLAGFLGLVLVPVKGGLCDRAAKVAKASKSARASKFTAKK